jgi:hypothetical protein
MKYYAHMCRFRMSPPLFLCIMRAIEDHDDYFVQKRNAVNKLIVSYLQKVIAAFRMLCNRVATNITDEHVCIGESTTIEYEKTGHSSC